MKNFRFEICGDELVIRVNLNECHGLSKSGRSKIVASTEGNLRLFDANGYRSEIINFSVTKKAGEADT